MQTESCLQHCCAWWTGQEPDLPSDLSSTHPPVGSLQANCLQPWLQQQCNEQPAFQEVVLFIPTLTLHLCVNELHDSFSINSGVNRRGKHPKAGDWHFTLWKRPRKSYFLHFGICLRGGQVSETRGRRQLGHITLNLGLHVDPLRLSRPRHQDR